MRAGYAGRQRFLSTRDPLGVRVSLRGDHPLRELREIGRRGDVVIGWS